jgi:acetoin utilization deacetylase AcuC-like enzyme
MSLKVLYCDHHEFQLPEGHKFPLAKYRQVREKLQGNEHFALCPAPFAMRAEIERVHDPGYVDKFLTGSLEPSAMRRIGLPWSRGLVRRTLASAGATLAAAHEALQSGFGGTLAGGTHHAFHAEGSGFCVFNDLAVAVMAMRAETGIRRVAIVDLDVHQGDGTAAIFHGDGAVFTLSIHGSRNFPFRKQQSVLDIELPDGTEDHEYASALGPAMERIWSWQPELILYQSGVDSLAADRLGRLSLTAAGLAMRDELVIRGAKLRGIPLVVTLGGGYGNPLQQTVTAHAQTFLIAAEIYSSFCGLSL